MFLTIVVQILKLTNQHSWLDLDGSYFLHVVCNIFYIHVYLYKKKQGQDFKQPRSQGLYSSRPLTRGGKKRDPGNQVGFQALSAI